MKQISFTNVNANNDSALEVTSSTPIKTAFSPHPSFTESPQRLYSPKDIKYTFNSTPVLASRPRVNFHSIADLAGSPSDSIGSSGYISNDSGMITMYNTPKQETNYKEEPQSCVEGKKNQRTTFTDFQRQQLEVYFIQNPYPDPRETEELGQRLGLGEAVIKVWFQNKRSRDKQRKFSHKNRAALKAMENAKRGAGKNNINALYASPVLNNLQMFSRLSNYQTAMAVIQNQNAYLNNGSFY